MANIEKILKKQALAAKKRKEKLHAKMTRAAKYISIAAAIRSGTGVVFSRGASGAKRVGRLNNPSRIPLTTAPRALTSRGNASRKAFGAGAGNWVNVVDGGLPSLGRRR